MSLQFNNQKNQRNQNNKTLFNSIRKHISRYSGRLYSLAGLLCVLAVIVGVALYVPKRLQAAPGTGTGGTETVEEDPNGWDRYPEVSALRDWEFNKPYGSVAKLGDLKIIGIQGEGNSAIPYVAVETSEELSAVLSGVKTKKDGTNEKRNRVIIFKQMSDLVYSGSVKSVEKNSGDSYSTVYSFEKDIYDGQGYTITCDGQTVNSSINPQSLSVTETYYGLLFGRVCNGAVIQNLTVAVNSVKIVGKINNSSKGLGYKISVGDLCAMAENCTISDVIVEGTDGQVGNISNIVEMQTYNETPLTVAAGGIIGAVKSDTEVERCEENIKFSVDIEYPDGNTGNVAKQETYSGGIAGLVLDGNNTFAACYSRGPVVAGESGQGGMVGKCEGDLTVWYSVSDNYADAYGAYVGNFFSFESYMGGQIPEYDAESTFWVYFDNAEGGTLELDHPHTIGNRPKMALVGYENPKLSEPIKVSTEENGTTNYKATFRVGITNQTLPDTSVSLQTKIGEDAEWKVDYGSVEIQNLNDYFPKDICWENNRENWKDIKLQTRVEMKCESEANTIIMRSPVWSQTYMPDEFIYKPELKVSTDNVEYNDLAEDAVYPLENTTLKLTATPDGPMDSLDLYYYLSLNNESLETVNCNEEYVDGISLNELNIPSGVKRTVYLYVKAVGIDKRNDATTTYNKTFRYDIAVSKTAGLIKVYPEGIDSIPDGYKVKVEVKDTTTSSYPYGSMRVLVSKEDTCYSTLAGMAGVKLIEASEGNVTLTGDVGDIYLYVEPIVKDEYKNQYSNFVQQYKYKIIEKAPDLTVSADTKQYLAKGTTLNIQSTESGVVVYNTAKEKTAIAVEAVVFDSADWNAIKGLTDDKKTNISDASGNTYIYAYNKDDKTGLYLQCGKIWYKVTSAAALSIKAFENKDGSFIASVDEFTENYEAKRLGISTMLFVTDKAPSDNGQFQYTITPETAAPTANTSAGSKIDMRDTLKFSCAEDCYDMYYVAYNPQPQLDATAYYLQNYNLDDYGLDDSKLNEYVSEDDDRTLGCLGKMKHYDPDTGIDVKFIDRAMYGEEVTIKIVAYPTGEITDIDDRTEEYRGGDKKGVRKEGRAPSKVMTFNYTIKSRDKWQQYERDSSQKTHVWTDLGDWKFNVAVGETDRLSDLNYLGTVKENGVDVPCAEVANAEQLEAVLSGLQTESKETYNGVEYEYKRTQKVIFKLTQDIEYSHALRESTNNIFKLDTFDGLEHTITYKYESGSGNSSEGEMYYGCLFGKVENAVIRNLKLNYASVGSSITIKAPTTESDTGSYYVGLGGICGVADNAKFFDIGINGSINNTFNVTDTNTNRLKICSYGGVAGVVQSNVTIRRCEDNSAITTSKSEDKSSLMFAGGIVGQITGSNNTIRAGYGKKDAALVGGLTNDNAAVSMQYCVGNLMIGARWDGAGYNRTECYFTTSEHKFNVYTVNGTSYESAEIAETNVTYLQNKREQIEAVDWGYKENEEQGDTVSKHYLFHGYGYTNNDTTLRLSDIKFGMPTIVKESDDSQGIKIKFTTNIGEQTEIQSNNDVKSVKGYLYLSKDGNSPQIRDLHLDKGNIYYADEIFKEINEPKKINARVKVVLTYKNGTEMEIWGEEDCYQYEPSDIYISKPDLAVSKENKEYEPFSSQTAYPLGNTMLQLTAKSPVDNVTMNMYCYFGEKSGLKLADTKDEEHITSAEIKLDTRVEDANEAFQLKGNMRKNKTSSMVYMYVLVEAKPEGHMGEPYCKLYEYDLVVYAKDELVVVAPENNSNVPNGSKVIFKVGNQIEDEYPYDIMNVLVSNELKQYISLKDEIGKEVKEGEAVKKGKGTKTDPFYLYGEVVLKGEPGQDKYVYVEPIVNEESLSLDKIPYSQRYASFVQQYKYTIMKKATGLAMAPATVTLTQTETPANVSVNENIYMSSQGNDDIIVYDITGTDIVPKMVEDPTKIDELDKAEKTEVGKNAYYWEQTDATLTVSGNVPGKGNVSDGSMLYVRCNGYWYSIKATEGLRIYEDGKLSFDASYAGKYVYISTLLFSSGYDPSDSITYKYRINEPDMVGAPSALLADGSSIGMNTILNFMCDSDCIMYYTTDGKEPQVSVETGAEVLVAKDTTKRYFPSEGIAVTTENGYKYGDKITIKIKAYPVENTDAEPPVGNKNKKSSITSIFTYTIMEQNQVAAPVAYPATTTENPATVVNGDAISLSCTTSGADIYYTLNGEIPEITEQNKYTGTIKVEGEHGSFFRIVAVAHKDGMKDSEMVTLLYRIADKETVNGVTAIPGTTTRVVAGDKIILSTTESGADIYYTTDGTTPSVSELADGSYALGEGVFKYNPEQSVTVPEGSGYFVVHAIAVKPNMNNSPVAQFIYTYADSVGVPYGNPAPGTVTENTQVVLQCAQEDAVIYYEVAYGNEEPGEPSTGSAVFSVEAPIVITRDTTIKAFAYYERESSAVVTLRYTLAQKMDAPGSSISSGSIVASGTTVNLPVGNGKVYYTIDGSDPTDSANAAVNIGSSVVITGKPGDKVIVKACTKETGATTSEMVTYTYQISQYPGGVTTDTPSGSTMAEGASIYLMTDVTDGVIYYTTGSGSPITGGTAGNSVVLNGKPGENITVKAVAIAPNTTMSGSYASFDYKFMEQLAAPHASLKDGTKLTEKTSVVLKANAGTIYFTIDGTDPSKASHEYTAPIVVSKDMTIKAIAMEEGSANSEISSFSYTFAEKVKAIKSSVSSDNTIQSGKVISLSTATPGARIYYTTDGTEPSPDAEEGVFVYDESVGISIYRNVNIKAIATLDGLCNSDILSLNYVVEEVPVEVERERTAREEAEAGLKPSDMTELADRREQSDEETEKNDGEVELHDYISDTLIRGRKSLIPDDTTLRAKEIIVPDEAVEEVRRLLGDDYELVCNYDFTLYRNGEEIQPDGLMEVGVPIAERYEQADVMLVAINEKNGVTLCDTVRKDGYAYASVTHLNNYALAGANVDSDKRRELDLIKVMSVGAGILVLAGIGMIIVTRVRRKRY